MKTKVKIGKIQKQNLKCSSLRDRFCSSAGTDSTTNQGWRYIPVISVLARKRLEARELKFILGYPEGLRPAWYTRDRVCLKKGEGGC